MRYTIATLQEHHKDDPLTLSIDKVGNKFLIGLWSRARGGTNKTFYSLDEAYAVFEKLASWMIRGFYSESDKRTYLATGNMKCWEEK